MGTRLRDGLTFCWCGDRAIFLDLHADRYFCLPPAGEAAFRSLQFSRDHGHVDQDLLAALPAGLIMTTKCDEHTASCRSGDFAGECALDQNLPRGSAIAVARAGWMLIRTKVQLKRVGLAGVIAELRDLKGCSRLVSTYSTGQALSAFSTLSCFVSARDGCLPWSIALARDLFARGLAAELVIGVTLRPFRAHCWVRKGSTVFNDRVENVRPYTPILVV